MSMKYVRDTYHVPCFRGARVRPKLLGWKSVGRITSASNHVRVKFESDAGRMWGTFHPTDLEYLDGWSTGYDQSYRGEPAYHYYTGEPVFRGHLSREEIARSIELYEGINTFGEDPLMAWGWARVTFCGSEYDYACEWTIRGHGGAFPITVVGLLDTAYLSFDSWMEVPR